MVDCVDTHELSASSQSPLVALAALWTTLLLLVSLIEYPVYLHHPDVPLWKPLALAGLPTAALLLWLIVELRSERYFQLPLEPPRPWFLRQLLRLPLLVAGYLIIVIGARRAIFFHGADPDPLALPIRFQFEIIKSSLFYCLWLGLAYGTLSLILLREKSAQLDRVQKALAESQLAQLRSQLRPHFLFNSLNTISSLMQTDVRHADRMLTRLGDLLRASLGADRNIRMPLREELGLLRLYTDIMVERFSDRVLVEWEIAEDALGLMVPAMLLQPLMENAFKYGVERTTGHEKIRVTACRSAGQLRIVIVNTGSSLGESWAPGVGIANCRERLQILYGGDAVVTLVDVPGAVPAEVQASIVIPFARQTA